MELLLRVHPRRRQRPDGSVSDRPRGSVVFGKCDAQRKAIWIAAAGYYFSPARRDHYTRSPFHRTLSDLWQPAYLNIYHHLKDVIELGNPSPAEWQTAIDTAWADLTRDGRLRAALGRDSRGEVDVVESVPWGPGERRDCCIIRAEERTAGRAECDALQEWHTYEDPASRVQVNSPRWRFDYRTDLGLTAREIAEIEDPHIVVDPRLLMVIPQSLARPVTALVAKAAPRG